MGQKFCIDSTVTTPFEGSAIFAALTTVGKVSVAVEVVISIVTGRVAKETPTPIAPRIKPQARIPKMIISLPFMEGPTVLVSPLAVSLVSPVGISVVDIVVVCYQLVLEL
jgi:hypothetical protein